MSIYDRNAGDRLRGLPPIVHRSDPGTSHRSAAQITASGTRRTHMELVYQALKAHPGTTARELMPYTGLAEYPIRRRLSDLIASQRASRDGEREGNSCWFAL